MNLGDGVKGPFRSSHNKKEHPTECPHFRAIDGARTRGLHLGKVALYQLSYYRMGAFVNAMSNIHDTSSFVKGILFQAAKAAVHGRLRLLSGGGCGYFT